MAEKKEHISPKEEEQLDSIVEKIADMAQMNFDSEVIITEDESKINIIAQGLHWLAEELQDNMVERTLLERKNKELEQFTYMATHDLKVPINNIEGIAALLKDELQDNKNPELLEYVQWIEKSVEQSKKTISNLINVAKVVNSAAIRDFFQAKPIINQTIESHQSLLEGSGFEITVDIDDQLQVYFNSGAFETIVSNIVGNAFKYRRSDVDFKLYIAASSMDKTAKISFSDNGKGIDLKNKGEKLFGLFQRLDTSVDGSGIGLYMIKQIIQDAGGEIKVSSELGKGSTFTILIPNN